MRYFVVVVDRAAQFNNLEESARIYSDAMEIDPRNKGTNAKILASRAEVYAKVPIKSFFLCFFTSTKIVLKGLYHKN